MDATCHRRDQISLPATIRYATHVGGGAQTLYATEDSDLDFFHWDEDGLPQTDTRGNTLAIFKVEDFDPTAEQLVDLFFGEDVVQLDDLSQFDEWADDLGIEREKIGRAVVLAVERCYS